MMTDEQILRIAAANLEMGDLLRSMRTDQIYGDVQVIPFARALLSASKPAVALTDEQIDAIWDQTLAKRDGHISHRAFARAVLSESDPCATWHCPQCGALMHGPAECECGSGYRCPAPLLEQSTQSVTLLNFKEALHAHFNEFPIPTQLGVVAIMRHIETVYAATSTRPAAPAQSGESVAVRSGEDLTVTNIPARIYLNLGDIYAESESEISFQSLTDITWCEDRIDDEDIEYVRAEGSIGEPFPYQKTFHAIAAATSVSAGHVAISITKFREAFCAAPQPVAQTSEDF